MAATKTTTTKKASTKKASKKAGAKGAAPKAADRAATAAAGEKAPAAASEATGATPAKDGAVAAAKQSPKAALAGRSKTKAGQADAAKAPKVEILTEDEAKARGGMTEIIKTLKGRDPAMRLAAKAGGFVIAHEDGRYSAAKTPEAAEAPEAAADAADKPAKKYDMATAPGKALDHIVKESKRRAKAKAAEKPGAAKPAKGAKQAKAPKAPKAPKAKKVSALDAAAQVLAKAKQPMRAKELIEQMAAEGLWTSPGGKTPEATLYAAMVREIGKKGDDARFRKADRGTFVATAKSGKGA